MPGNMMQSDTLGQLTFGVRCHYSDDLRACRYPATMLLASIEEPTLETRKEKRIGISLTTNHYAINVP